MNTPNVPAPKVRGIFVHFAAVICLFLGIAQVRADIPDRTSSSIALAGMYKVAASSDPFFPVASDREWFMDFGKGTTEKQAGKVAVSLRQNPNVKVRIMVWQVFPGTAQLYLGNQFSEGSRQAVAVADWKISNQGDQVILERHGCQIVLNRADPSDY